MLLRIALATLMLVGATAVSDTAPQSPSSQKPNIIIFLVDDLGWQDTQVSLTEQATPLNIRYHTPNEMKLAADGIKFTDFYAAAPVCSPTRVTLITGQSPAKTHVTNWTQKEGQDTSEPFPILLPPDWNVNGVSPMAMDHAFSGPVLPSILRDAGYRTIHVGKAHWGAVGTKGADPMNLGFDVNIGGSGAGQPGSYLSEKHYSSGPGDGQFRDVPGLEKYWNTGTFLTEALTLEANRALDESVAMKTPFFLHFAHFAVHTPLEEDARFMKKYLDAGLPPVEARYASLIEGVDKSIGDVLANVERHGLTNNTLVLFMSDNGGLAAHTRAEPLHTANAPLRSGKGSAYEGGIRVPLIMRWPGKIKPTTITHTPAITDDIFPTLLDVAGVTNAAFLTRDVLGRNLRPLVTDKGKLPDDRPLLWHYPHFWGVKGPGIEPFSALRVGKYKLLFFYADRRYELYDLTQDIGETTDISKTNTGETAKLTKMMRAALEKAGAQMPLDPTTKLPVALPPLVK